MSLNDQQLDELLKAEIKRQKEGAELIPSENYVSKGVLEALGSVYTNKYSEGYPGKRYYGGQANMDQVENLAIERAKKLFRCDHANVQPLGGANANIAVYFAWLDPGDTVLGMDLSHGGHLTHGSPVTYMAKLFRFVRYGMKNIETGEIDYEGLRQSALKEKPKIILAGFSGYPRELDYAKFSAIAKEVGAVAMADMAHIAGLIAGGVHKNPFDYGFHVRTTTTHKTLRGPRGAIILSKGVVGNPLKAPEKTIENLPTLIDRSVFPGFQGGPHMHQIAAKAVALGEAMEAIFRKNNVRMITGGTSNHVIQLDVFGSLGVSGKEAQTVLDEVGITINMNAIPDDSRKPFDPSGVRLGTPAITTRGFKEKDCALVAELMIETLKNKDDAKKKAEIRKKIKALAKKFP